MASFRGNTRFENVTPPQYHSSPPLKAENDCPTCFVLNNTENSFTNYTEFNYNLVSIDELVIDLVGSLKSNNLRTFNLRAPPVV